MALIPTLPRTPPHNTSSSPLNTSSENTSSSPHRTPPQRTPPYLLRTPPHRTPPHRTPLHLLRTPPHRTPPNLLRTPPPGLSGMLFRGRCTEGGVRRLAPTGASRSAFRPAASTGLFGLNLATFEIPYWSEKLHHGSTRCLQTFPRWPTVSAPRLSSTLSDPSGTQHSSWLIIHPELHPRGPDRLL